MNWTALIVALAVLAALFLLRRSGQVSPAQAAEYLKNGAIVIDVRSAAEYMGGHLPRAINIPLSEIESVIGRKVKDKTQVLLLHCASGMRSGTARKQLLAMGYPNVFNLGSYGRAAGIVGSR